MNAAEQKAGPKCGETKKPKQKQRKKTIDIKANNKRINRKQNKGTKMGLERDVYVHRSERN